MSDAIERWLPVLDYEGLYEVSDHGRVRSVDRVVPNGSKGMRLRGKILKPHGDKTGRQTVVLCENAVTTTRRVHALVLEAFEGPRPPGMEGCHSDGNPSNNRLSNLQWGTRSAHCLNAVRRGTHNRTSRAKCPRGHELVEPNLTVYSLQQGYRVCLSCSRARGRASSFRKQGRDLDLATVADKIYAEVMAQG